MTLLEQAERQLADYDRHRPGMLFAANGQPDMTVDDAYRLQMEVARLRDKRGETIAGYKIGCISPVMQTQLGLGRPVFGHIYASELHGTGVVLNPEQYDGLAIEGELGIRIAQDIPGIDWLRSHRNEALAAGFAVIELHNYVFRNSPHTAQELIANNAIHAGVVLPPRETSIKSFYALLDEPLSVWKNGECLGTETGRALPDGPLGSLMRLVEHLERFRRHLHRGQLVLTGSPLGLYRVEDRDRIEVVCGKLGGSVVATISRTAAANKG